MDKLKPTLKINGYDFDIIIRSNKVALLKKKHAKHYEVVRVYTIPSFTMWGKSYPSREIITHNDKFGRDGSLAFRSYEDALAHFKTLNARHQGRIEETNGLL